MVFTSFAFCFFFAALLLTMGILSFPVIADRMGNGVRRVVLLISCYVFYGWWDWRLCFLLLGITLTAYFTAIHIEKHRDAKIGLFFGIAVPLLVLTVCKYTNFFLGSFRQTFGLDDMGTLKIILPLGISFYTFQSVGYIVDVHRGKQAPVHDLVKYSLFAAFFPVIVSGPIMRANDFFSQLEEDRRINPANLAEGAQIFLFGLAKKLVFADHLALFVNQVYGAPSAFHSGTVFLATISYSLQLYFDFSGYSDMAIGCAKCLGFDLKKNFNIPYLSRNVTEFWKRWHISLSSWLMDYLYIPLGGNRKGQKRTYINLIATMVLGGLWHGANWTFIIWGLLHGLILAFHKFYLLIRKLPKNHRSNNPVTVILSILMTFMIVNFTWVFFRADSFGQALVIIKRIFQWEAGVVHHYVWSYISIAITLICTGVAFMKSRKADGFLAESVVEGFYPVFNLNKFWSLVLVLFAAGLILGLAFTGGNPFIYLQF